jgi:hypothetical protein
VESLTEAWLYLGKEPHGLNVEQEASLKARGFIHPVLLDDWYCDSCEQRHDYRMERGVALKACPHNYDDWEPVTESDRQQWWWNVKKIKQTLIETNSLSPRHEKNQKDSIYYVGSYSDQLLCLSAYRTEEQLIKASAFLPQNLELINLYPLFLSKPQSLGLPSLTVHLISEIVKNAWLIRCESEQKATIILNPRLLALTINGTIVRLTPQTTTTALILLRSKNGLNNLEFEKEYQQATYDSLKATPCASYAIKELNKKIKQALPDEAKLFSGNKSTNLFSFIGKMSSHIE